MLNLNLDKVDMINNLNNVGIFRASIWVVTIVIILKMGLSSTVFLLELTLLKILSWECTTLNITLLACDLHQFNYITHSYCLYYKFEPMVIFLSSAFCVLFTEWKYKWHLVHFLVSAMSFSWFFEPSSYLVNYNSPEKMDSDWVLRTFLPF